MIECLDRGHAGQSGAQGAFAHCLCFKQFYGPDGDPDPGFVRGHQHLRHLGAYAYIIVQTSRGPLPSSSRPPMIVCPGCCTRRKCPRCYRRRHECPSLSHDTHSSPPWRGKRASPERCWRRCRTRSGTGSRRLSWLRRSRRTRRHLSLWQPVSREGIPGLRIRQAPILAHRHPGAAKEGSRGAAGTSIAGGAGPAQGGSRGCGALEPTPIHPILVPPTRPPIPPPTEPLGLIPLEIDAAVDVDIAPLTPATAPRPLASAPVPYRPTPYCIARSGRRADGVRRMSLPGTSGASAVDYSAPGS